MIQGDWGERGCTRRIVTSWSFFFGLAVILGDVVLLVFNETPPREEDYALFGKS